MELQSADVRKKLQDQWPDLVWIMLTDPIFYAPTFSEVKEMIKKDPGQTREYIPNIYACEEFSLSLMVAVRQKRADDYLAGKTVELNWALGLILTQKGNKIHYQNVCITSDQGVLLIEPQADIVVQAGIMPVKAHYVFM